MFSPLLLIKLTILTGLSLWLSIACINNVVDRRTNQHLLTQMFRMIPLTEEKILGQGLLIRAWANTKNIPLMLWGIVTVQACISLLLWCSAFIFAISLFAIQFLPLATAVSNIALLCFCLLWLGFLCGGLWFGYWIKMPRVQMVHLTLLGISLLAILVINQPLY